MIVCGATYIAGWLMNRVARGPALINYLHGEELLAASESRFLRPVLSRQQMQAIRRATVNIAVSRYTADQAVRLADVRKDRVVILPNFVDTERFKPPGDREALRARLGWKGRRVILSLARLTPRKGIDQAIRAVGEMRRGGELPEDWRYVIAGTGEQENALKELAAQLGLNEVISFAGFVPDNMVPDYYGAADIFLQPNRDISGDTEGFGIVFIESAACGTPVIGGLAGGTADAIREGINGFRVNADDVTSVAKAIRSLVRDEALRRTMAQAGTAMVQRDFRVESAVRRIEDLLLRALGQYTAVPHESLA
jgi:phosphatidylinositol alpha-1,6-mannosyltransferase